VISAIDGMVPQLSSAGSMPFHGRAWRHFVETDDIDTHANSQPDWALRYEQLSGGSFQGMVRHLQLPGVRLVHEGASRAMRQRGALGHDSYGFALAIDLPGAAFFNGQRLDANSIMAGRADDLDLCSPEMFSMIGAVVSTELLSSLWEQMHQTRLAPWLDAQLVVRAQPETVQTLRSLHLDTLSTMTAPTMDDTALLQLRDAILIEWIEALPASADTSELKTAAARKRVVDRACDLLLSHAAEPMSILQLCSRIGASRRKLNYCFQDVLGTTPVKYLRAVRLNGVRRELKAVRDAHTGVQDVATRWGFWHLGQFSLDYKRQFGELPSTTLRAVRGA
jgi:AraC family transcriptional regulator, ethanolamine operon transcriptional activator